VAEPPTIRHARPDELADLVAIEAASDGLFSTIGFDLFPGPATVAAMARAPAVLVAGDPPVGFARVEEVDGLAHLEQLSVAPDHGRRGIGRALLEAACDWARDAGYEAITLVTFQDVAWNAPFYASASFRPLSALTPGLIALREIDRVNKLDDLGPRVVMVRRLN
jgi:GNAT superfamily N-acetyltransferase